MSGRPVRRSSYAIAAVAILIIEIGIALFVRDRFVRPYVGDTLAVILVYLVLRSTTPLRVVPATVIALTIAFAVELGQLFGFLNLVGLGTNPVARVVFGTGFETRDLLAYAIGALCVLAIEWARMRAPAARARGE